MDTKLSLEEFFWDNIRNGVDKDKREDALVWFFSYLMEHEYPGEQDALTLILYWNRLNRPPLLPENVINIYRDLWKNYPFPTVWESQIKKKVPPPITLGAWFPEAESGLAVWHKIMRKGSHYEVSPLFDNKGFKTSTINVILITWLPIYRLKETAVNLAAEICGHYEWLSPENVDEMLWRKQFIMRVKDTEKMIDEKLSKLSVSDRSIALREMLILDEYYEQSQDKPVK